LSSFDEATFEPDGFTSIVASNSRDLLLATGYDASITPHPGEPSYRFFLNDKSVARIVEGCNAISVIILFVAFVVAFTGRAKHTFLFIIGGILLIHILNVARISGLVLGLVYYPQYKTLMHDILFPLFIYGIVFGLWVIWVKKFSVR
jgi:exosortase family protein XrtF